MYPSQDGYPGPYAGPSYGSQPQPHGYMPSYAPAQYPAGQVPNPPFYAHHKVSGCCGGTGNCSWGYEASAYPLPAYPRYGGYAQHEDYPHHMHAGCGEHAGYARYAPGCCDSSAPGLLPPQQPHPLAMRSPPRDAQQQEQQAEAEARARAEGAGSTLHEHYQCAPQLRWGVPYPAGQRPTSGACGFDFPVSASPAQEGAQPSGHGCSAPADVAASGAVVGHACLSSTVGSACGGCGTAVGYPIQGGFAALLGASGDFGRHGAHGGGAPLCANACALVPAGHAAGAGSSGEELGLGTLASNQARKIKTPKLPKSQFVGVSTRQDGKFKAVCVFQGQSIFIGAFSSDVGAALHYDIVAKPLGKKVNDDARAKALMDGFPAEARMIVDAVRAVDHAQVRHLAKHVASLYASISPSCLAQS